MADRRRIKRQPINTHGLHIEMAVHQDSLLLGIVPDTPKDRGWQGQLFTIHRMFAEIDELRLDADSFEVAIEPFGHLNDIAAVCCVPTYTVFDAMVS